MAARVRGWERARLTSSSAAYTTCGSGDPSRFDAAATKEGEGGGGGGGGGGGPAPADTLRGGEISWR